ncbi:endonuclease/exonuclease/phosphatase family metal-dependent hydrolase [Chitinophaga dinghuensis]|uniref:Endonuclease/exonuclease/phosphatase family metal-dependent hydrolase n=1 Tax=Chitinophaga dinghuensis TaxID=1539050 RepID=A0A327W6L4_9BACT|nr:endonuclease/exonuclease/phosphatase family protein [Chitinophaga dinghuensis]RAJ85591.1 endonuclease/exonuclease/phosphatase family metal-dependent hydrolase [Chitinophaga dinghuensis]
MNTFLRSFLLILNILLAVALLASNFLPYIDPASFWPAGFAGLTFPFLLVINLVFLPVWLLFRKKYWLLPLVAIVLSVSAIVKTWAFHPFNENSLEKSADSKEFTVMTYNTSNMGLKYFTEEKAIRSNVYNTIVFGQADILCLQEFYTNDRPDYTHNIDSIRNKAGYEYHYFTKDKTHWDTWYYGIALFSHHPILKATAIPCGVSTNGSGSSFLQADLLVHGDTIRVITLQLVSYMLNGGDMSAAKDLHFRPLIHKMKQTFTHRSAQAAQLAGLIQESPFPVIVCGDFNDVPVSYTYRKISSGLQDAFSRAGNGLGRTMSYISPTLRIDYILASKQLQVLGCQTMRVADSEHFPVIARLSLKK